MFKSSKNYNSIVSKITTPVVLFTFLVLSSVSYSQDRVIDSLKIVLQNPKLHDTTKIQAISDVMDANYNDYDKNYYYLNNILGNLALKNYKKEKNPKTKKVYTEWVATYYSIVASEYSHKTDREKGLIYHDKAIALLRSIKSYDEMYVAYLSKAAYYVMMEKDDKAIPLIFEALKFFEKDKEKYTEQMPYALQMLYHVYSNQNQFEKAIAYGKKALECYELSYTKNPSNHTLYLKALSYSDIAYCYIKLKKFKETIAYCNKSLEITKKLGADTMTGLALSRSGEAQMKLSNFEEAEKLFREVLAMKTLSEATDNIAITTSMTGLGKLFYAQGDLKQASVYANKAFPLSKTTGNITLQKDAADLIYLISIRNKDYKKALEMYQFNEKIVDSSQIEASRNALAQQQLKYNFEKKELNLKLAAEKKNALKNNWLIALSSLLLVSLLGVYFYYLNNKQKQAITVLEKEQIKQKLLVTQMNPHFIFNSIDNIQGLIHNKKDKEAINYLTKFSKLTRQILENSNENYISLSEEIEMTQNYLAIQQLLYDNKFSFNITVEDNIDQEAIFLPPMLTQPFIENAIKHGLSTTTSQGQIDIHFYLKDAKLFFEVSDNGKGFETVQKTTNHKSLAMTITKERLVSYTKNQDFVVHTDNIKDTNENIVGAKVSFEIPYIYEN